MATDHFSFIFKLHQIHPHIQWWSDVKFFDLPLMYFSDLLFSISVIHGVIHLASFAFVGIFNQDELKKSSSSLMHV